jgi:hypothetical protein
MAQVPRLFSELETDPQHANALSLAHLPSVSVPDSTEVPLVVVRLAHIFPDGEVCFLVEDKLRCEWLLARASFSRER